MENLRDVFEHKIRTLYSTEQQLIEVLPKWREIANNPQLKIVFSDHFSETKRQIQRLEDICRELNIDPAGETSRVIGGFLQEAFSFISENTPGDIIDAVLIAEAQHIERYEISGYETAARFARELGYPNISRTLYRSYSEEENMDHMLSEIAESRIHSVAIA